MSYRGLFPERAMVKEAASNGLGGACRADPLGTAAMSRASVFSVVWDGPEDS